METAANNKNTSLIESMFQAGAHFGYSKTRRHPTFSAYLFGSKMRVDIIDLEKTGSAMNRTLAFIKRLAAEGKTILFVGTKPEAEKAFSETVIPLGVPYVTNRWIGGTLTNLPEIRKRIARYEELTAKKEKGELDVYTKKEKMLFDEEIHDLEKKFGGIVSMKQLPDALFIVDPRHEHTAVREARRKSIPVASLAGSDCDISVVDYPIPANDASLASIRLFVGKAADAYSEGLKEREAEKEKKEKGEAPPEIKSNS